MGLNIDKPGPLAPDQLGVYLRLCDVVRAPNADASYDRIQGAQNGRVISVDLGRFLATEFATWDGRLRHTPATGKPAGAYAHDRLIRELKNSQYKVKRLLITAGGAGSGKTTLLKGLIPGVSLVYDNQLRNVERAQEILLAAVANGWQAQVAYVHRPFEDVVRAVIERSERTGRWNRLVDLYPMHVECQRTLLQLWKRFSHQVAFSAQYNASPGVAALPKGSVIPIKEFQRGGAYHLINAKKSTFQLKVILEDAKRQGHVCEAAAVLIGQGIV